MVYNLKLTMADDVTEVFLPTDTAGAATEFNEQVEIFPEGHEARKVPTQAAVTQDGLEGTREVRGDGVSHNTPDGRSIRESVIIELPVAVESKMQMRPGKSGLKPDLIKIADGSIFAVKRILGRDDDMFTVLAVVNDHMRMKRFGNIG